MSGDDMRFEVPEDLEPEEERAVIAALEQYFRRDDEGPEPWTFAGRLDATGTGALQSRRVGRAWQRAARSTFARQGVAPFAGRGDAR